MNTESLSPHSINITGEATGLKVLSPLGRFLSTDGPGLWSTVAMSTGRARSQVVTRFW